MSETIVMDTERKKDDPAKQLSELKVKCPNFYRHIMALIKEAIKN